MTQGAAFHKLVFAEDLYDAQSFAPFRPLLRDIECSNEKPSGWPRSPCVGEKTVREEFYRLRVKEIMILGGHAPFIGQDATWRELLAKLSQRAHAWVVNDTHDMTLVGIVTEHDMLRYVMPTGAKRETLVGTPKAEIPHEETTARDVMTSDPVTCSPTETVDDVLSKVSSFNVRRLAVVDETNTLIGEITLQLLVRTLRSKLMHTA